MTSSGRNRTVVHLLRHGEVHNPTGVLYGRLPGYRLSERGIAMAQRLAETLAQRDVRQVISSPLQRAQETARPVAAALGHELGIDERLIEAGNKFQGLTFGVGDGSLKRPTHWRHLWNPFRPSWGEAYADIASRMLAAVDAARGPATGGEVVLVSHQLPIWTIRSHLEGRRLWHDPRKRQCTLASLTSLVYDGDRLVEIDYSEPAADLLPVKAGSTFSAGA
jgi:broad specificity phosphatase PhoE